MYQQNEERQGVIGRNEEIGRSVAGWVLVTGRASSEDGMFQRNMLPIHGGQEIKLSLSTSPPFSPHSFTLNSAGCLFTPLSRSHSLTLCPCVFHPFPLLPAFVAIASFFSLSTFLSPLSHTQRGSGWLQSKLPSGHWNAKKEHPISLLCMLTQAYFP